MPWLEDLSVYLRVKLMWLGVPLATFARGGKKLYWKGILLKSLLFSTNLINFTNVSACPGGSLIFLLYRRVHPIRTLNPNKIIVSNKVLGLLGLGSGLGSGSGCMK